MKNFDEFILFLYFWQKGPIDDDVQPVVKAKSVDNTSAPPLENSIPPVKTGNESGVVRSNAI